MKMRISDFERMSTLIIFAQHIITQTGQHSFLKKDPSEILSPTTKKGAIS